MVDTRRVFDILIKLDNRCHLERALRHKDVFEIEKGFAKLAQVESGLAAGLALISQIQKGTKRSLQ